MSEDQNIPTSGHDDVPENQEPHKAVPEKNAISPTPTANQQLNHAQSAIQTMEAHHPHHVTHKKKWAEYLLEFFMLFLAVFLGFVAENIREHAVEKERARQYAASLVHDLEKDTAMVQIDIMQIKNAIAKVDSLALFLRNRKISEISNKQLFAYTFIDAGYRPYTWNRATIEEIKSSGSLRYFDDSIVMRISAYDALTKHMDADFSGDMERLNKLVEKKNRIVDRNYNLPDREMLRYWMHADSIINVLSRYNGQQDLLLLSTDNNEIKSMVNDYIDAADQFNGRGNDELPRVITQASQLITLLQREYHLKDE